MPILCTLISRPPWPARHQTCPKHIHKPRCQFSRSIRGKRQDLETDQASTVTWGTDRNIQWVSGILLTDCMCICALKRTWSRVTLVGVHIQNCTTWNPFYLLVQTLIPQQQAPYEKRQNEWVQTKQKTVAVISKVHQPILCEFSCFMACGVALPNFSQPTPIPSPPWSSLARLWTPPSGWTNGMAPELAHGGFKPKIQIENSGND